MEVEPQRVAVLDRLEPPPTFKGWRVFGHEPAGHSEDRHQSTEKQDIDRGLRLARGYQSVEVLHRSHSGVEPRARDHPCPLEQESRDSCLLERLQKRRHPAQQQLVLGPYVAVDALEQGEQLVVHAERCQVRPQVTNHRLRACVEPRDFHLRSHLLPCSKGPFVGKQRGLQQELLELRPPCRRGPGLGTPCLDQRHCCPSAARRRSREAFSARGNSPSASRFLSELFSPCTRRQLTRSGTVASRSPSSRARS